MSTHEALRTLFLSTALIGVLFVATPAKSATLVFGATLSGGNENPAVVTAGTGSTTITIDNVANTMRVQVNFSGLNGNTTASHIHCCTAPTGNAGVATELPSFVNFPLGVSSGTYDRTYDMNLAASYGTAFLNNNGGTAVSAFSALITGMSAGQAYLNVHSSASPGGEIRGNLVFVVPEPAIWGSMLVGFSLIGAAMRRPTYQSRIRY